MGSSGGGSRKRDGMGDTVSLRWVCGWLNEENRALTVPAAIGDLYVPKLGQSLLYQICIPFLLLFSFDFSALNLKENCTFWGV